MHKARKQLRKGLAYLIDKQEEKRKEAKKREQEYQARSLAEETVARELTERYQKLISFLFIED